MEKKCETCKYHGIITKTECLKLSVAQAEECRKRGHKEWEGEDEC